MDGYEYEYGNLRKHLAQENCSVVLIREPLCSANNCQPHQLKWYVNSPLCIVYCRWIVTQRCFYKSSPASSTLLCCTVTTICHPGSRRSYFCHRCALLKMIKLLASEIYEDKHAQRVAGQRWDYRRYKSKAWQWIAVDSKLLPDFNNFNKVQQP